MCAANAAPNRRLQARIGTAMMPEHIAAFAAATPCLIQQASSIPAQGGQVFGNLINLKMSCRAPTLVTA